MPSFTISSRQKRIGLIVADNLLALWIELEGPPHARSNVGKVSDAGREVSDLDIGLGATPASNGIEEIVDMIAGQLEEQKQAVLSIQKKLLKGGGLMLLDDVDGAVQKIQILIDRVKTASYGYAGFFDAVRIKEEQLDALHRFDVALAARVVDVQRAVERLDTAVTTNENIGPAIEQLTDLVAELNILFNRRHEAIISPDLLTDTSYAPEVDPNLLSAGS